MGVQVGHALADDVVDGHEGAVGLERLLHRRRHPLHPFEVGPDLGGRKVYERHHVTAGYDEHVTREHGSPIEEGNGHVVIEDEMSRLLAGDDAAEDVVWCGAHGGPVSPGERRNVALVRVTLFVTCVVDLFDPDVGVATVQALRASGSQVSCPSGQTCCGQPAWNSGFHHEAARVASTTLDALERDGGEAVVVPAGSCATMVKVFWPELFELAGDHDAADRALAIGALTHELTAFLAERALALRPLGHRVAYHHSCHMLRELRVQEQPEQLLDAAGCERVSWDADTRCCGFGGLFSFKLPEVSEAMADDKLASLSSADPPPELVVGADGSCLLHLRARAEHEGRPIVTRHIAQLIADALP